MFNLKKFFILGVSAGLNRAGMFLLMPLLAAFLSVRDFGEVSLYLTISTIMVSILSFNISSIVAREVYDDLVGVVAYLKPFNIILLFAFLPICILFSFIYEKTIFYYCIFIISEALFLVNSTYIRYRLGDAHFFYITLAKFISISILMVIYFTVVNYNDLMFRVEWFFIILSVSNTPIIGASVRFSLIDFKGRLYNELSSKIKYILFAITLFPHVLALWISSGLDRYFIKWYYDAEVLGTYSFSYSLASLFLIVNAALSLALPQFAVKDFILYKSDGFYKKFILFITAIYLSFLIFLKIITPLFSKFDNDKVFVLAAIIASGFYLLVFYTYFSSILFYRRNTKLISVFTVVIAIMTILLLYPFSWLWGIRGTAIVTYVCYAVYAALVCYSVHEPDYGGISRLYIPLILSVTIVFIVII